MAAIAAQRAERPFTPVNRIRLLLQSTSLSLIVAVALTLWAHVLICLGMHPETIYSVDSLAPLFGVFCGATLAGRFAQVGWRAGGAAGILAVIFWFLAWSYLVSRLNPALWWQAAVCGLTMRHAVAWMAALLTSVAGGLIGGWFQRCCRQSRISHRNQRVAWLGLAISILVLLPVAMQSSILLRGEDYSGHPVPVSRGINLVSQPPLADGTQVRYLSFDLAAEPDLGVGIYDADSDDPVPFDNFNTTWLGQSVEFVLDKLQARLHHQKREVRCLVNGGFFGANDNWIGHHIAPIVVEGKPLYNTATLLKEWPDQAWVFGITKRGVSPIFHLEPHVPWKELPKFQTALIGVRPLRVDGRSLPLKPGIGNTRLRCSRTSVGWSNDSRHFYILSVREPDGESASLRQRKASGTQNGGWDVRQVQQFWERLSVPQAVLFDGGESTQLAFPSRPNRYLTVRSAWHLSRTLGYWRNRPLRIYLPLLPATENDGGVLNYFYMSGVER